MCTSSSGRFRSVSLISEVLLPEPGKSIRVIKFSVDGHKSLSALFGASRAKVMDHRRNLSGK